MNANYKEFSVLLTWFLYKKLLLYLVKNFTMDKDHKDLNRISEFGKYDLTVTYAYKLFG